jgi:hypothetical protein
MIMVFEILICSVLKPSCNQKISLNEKTFLNAIENWFRGENRAVKVNVLP